MSGFVLINVTDVCKAAAQVLNCRKTSIAEFLPFTFFFAESLMKTGVNDDNWFLIGTVSSISFF